MQGLTSVPSDEAERLLDALVAPFAHGEGAVAGLVKRLRRNKYPLLALDAAAKDHPLLSSSQTWRREVEADREEMESQRREYVAVRRAWANAGIPCAMFKSAGECPSFPYTSDNLDILVPANRLDDARRILIELGYIWLRNIDETQKFLFRRFRAGRSVSAIHVHTWVGWDVAFHEDAIWDGLRQSADDPEVTVPSAEDAVLVNVSHALYENKEVRLYDLEKVRSQWGSLHWDYVEGAARRRGWLDGLYFGLLVCAKLEREIYGYNTVPKNVRRRWHEGLKCYPFQWRYWRSLRKREFELPFAVSFAMSKALYYKKILRDSHDPVRRRLSNLAHTFAWGFKQKSGIRPQRGMLVSISGTDGAGKTAQAEALREALVTSEVYTDVVWSRIGTTPLYRRLSRVLRRSTGASRDSVDGGSGEPGLLRRALRFAWATANVLDLALAYQWRVRLPLMTGRVIVCDRYTYDAAAEIAERLGPWALQSMPAKLLFALAPRPRFAYLLDVPAEVAAGRSLDPEDAGRLARQRELYRQIAAERGLRVVDASGDLADAADVILREVLTDFEDNHKTLVNGLLLSNPAQLNPNDREAAL